MMDHIAAYTAWADYMDNAPMSDVFTDTYHNTLMALWLAYVDALSNGTAVQAYSDLITLKTPPSAPVTDIDPMPSYTPDVYHYAPLAKGRYVGMVNRNEMYIHCPELHQDFRIERNGIMGDVIIAGGMAVEFNVSKAFTTALRIVVLGNEASQAAYNALMTFISTPPVIVNPASKIIRETLYQKAQRLEREAAQREQARQQAHQPQHVDYMDAFYEGPIEADSQQQHAQDVRSDLI